jgi:hypothetical protein
MPLKALQKGLKTLTNHGKTRKEALQHRLAAKESISEQDKHWLDHNANLVDKQLVLEALESASDYEQGLSRLNNKQRGLVKKLYKAAGNFSKVAGKK